MSKCPNCNAPLSDDDLQTGQCPSCNKSLPKSSDTTVNQTDDVESLVDWDAFDEDETDEASQKTITDDDVVIESEQPTITDGDDLDIMAALEDDDEPMAPPRLLAAENRIGRGRCRLGTAGTDA